MARVLFSFLKSEDFEDPKVILPEGYSYSLWRPSLFSLKPNGASLFPFIVWWVFDFLRIFANRDYAVSTVYHGEMLVHYVGFFPRYFRFPFMDKGDLQLGDGWTHPDHRGKRIAPFSYISGIRSLRKQNRKFWGLIEEKNLSATRAFGKTGAKLIGEGIRRKRMGMRSLGTFELKQKYEEAKSLQEIGSQNLF